LLKRDEISPLIPAKAGNQLCSPDGPQRNPGRVSPPNPAGYCCSARRVQEQGYASKTKDARYLDIHEQDPLDEAQLAACVKQASQLPANRHRIMSAIDFDWVIAARSEGRPGQDCDVRQKLAVIILAIGPCAFS
jgi:hypothetical protein